MAARKSSNKVAYHRGLPRKSFGYPTLWVLGGLVVLAVVALYYLGQTSGNVSYLSYPGK